MQTTKKQYKIITVIWNEQYNDMLI